MSCVYVVIWSQSPNGILTCKQLLHMQQTVIMRTRQASSWEHQWQATEKDLL